MRTGAYSPQLQTEAEMVKAIREVGRVPVQRDTFYEAVKEWPATADSGNPSATAGQSQVLEQNLATA